jgi:hypothetical protein
MAFESMKNQMFRQSIMQTSTEQKEALGTLRILDDGRKFRYGKNGAGALTHAGLLVQALGITAHHQNMAVATATAGSTLVIPTLGATAATANYYADGFLQVYEGGTHIGAQYKVRANEAADASAACKIYLDEPIIAVLTNGTHKVSLVPNQYTGLVVATAVAQPVIGLTVRPMAANVYGWFQTGGVATVDMHTTTALGHLLVPAAAGRSTTAAGYTAPFIGYKLGVAGVQDKAGAAFLTID